MKIRVFFSGHDVWLGVRHESNQVAGVITHRLYICLIPTCIIYCEYQRDVVWTKEEPQFPTALAEEANHMAQPSMWDSYPILPVQRYSEERSERGVLFANAGPLVLLVLPQVARQNPEELSAPLADETGQLNRRYDTFIELVKDGWSIEEAG